MNEIGLQIVKGVDGKGIIRAFSCKHGEQGKRHGISKEERRKRTRHKKIVKQQRKHA